MQKVSKRGLASGKVPMSDLLAGVAGAHSLVGRTAAPLGRPGKSCGRQSPAPPLPCTLARDKAVCCHPPTGCHC